MKNNMLNKVIFSILLSAATAYASEGTIIEQKADTHKSVLEKNRIELSKDDRSQARAWQLNESEWRKYKEIMAGKRGIWTPGLDPITALGVHSSTERERMYYAELWVSVERDRAIKEIAFENAVQAAKVKLYGNEPVIDNKPFKEKFQQKISAIHDRKLALFTSLDCIECDELIPTLYKSMGDRGRLDIYIHRATANQIKAWAAKHDIPADLVKNRTITLNHTRLTDMLQLGFSTRELPKVYKLDAQGNAQDVNL